MRVAVTGAFGYSGRYIARRLLDAGHSVLTLTNSFHRPNPFGQKVTAFPLQFDQPGHLTESLRGVDALINTYWVRFNHRLFTHSQAVANTKILFQAAKDAEVKRIVHVSITNPDLRSELSYFRGKAELEAALTSLGVSYCILRPAVLFGKEDVLINNIAWSLRHFPIFGVFGNGRYKLQPIYVDDLAAAAVEKATGDRDEIINAIGPETFTYRDLLVHDVIITRQEIRGLMEGRLCVDAPPLGRTKLTDWILRHKDTLGRHYTSEMARRLDRLSEYRSN
jgi:NADH dehydrogenase